jgi:hypothetical protein
MLSVYPTLWERAPGSTSLECRSLWRSCAEGFCCTKRSCTGEHKTGEPSHTSLLPNDDLPTGGSVFQELLERNRRIEVIDHSATSVHRN